MDQQIPPIVFEQTAVYQLASLWLDDPGSDPVVLEWLKTLTNPDREQRQRSVFHRE
jgi:hypothetical protein